MQERSEESGMILSPHILALQNERKCLETEVSMLLLERDDLLLVQCPNIEMLYLLAFGEAEQKAYGLYCQVMRLKRKLEMIRAVKNRGCAVDEEHIEKKLDEEFAEYRRQLREQKEKLDAAKKRNLCEVLSEEEMKKAKKLYRAIIKSLHPDLHPQSTPEQIGLLQAAVNAYENGDLASLELIHTVVREEQQTPDEPGVKDSLTTEIRRLRKTLALLQKNIRAIQSDYPYRVREFIADESQKAKRKAEIEDTIAALEERETYLKNQIEELMR
ncbi:MAG: hypothetical protein PUB43_06525 [Oscillospiraceae bacterium]|nr:hypothetical protein [Oscillospiraceae bacterium]